MKNLNLKNILKIKLFLWDFLKVKKSSFMCNKIIPKSDDHYLYLLRNGGNLSTPIILVNNLKLVGLYRNKFEQDEKLYLGIPIKLIINKIDFIKCFFNLDHINRDI